MELRTEVLELIREACAVEEPNLCEESIFEEISIDSLSFIELIVRAEDKFGIEFDDEDLNIYGWKTVGDFIDRIALSGKK